MITITKSAAAQIKRSAQQNASDGSYLRIAAKKDEDGKLQYGLGFDQKTDNDKIYESGGIQFIVSELSAPYLKGAIIDFVEIAPGEMRFIVNNPNDPDHKPVD